MEFKTAAGFTDHLDPGEDLDGDKVQKQVAAHQTSGA